MSSGNYGLVPFLMNSSQQKDTNIDLLGLQNGIEKTFYWIFTLLGCVYQDLVLEQASFQKNQTVRSGGNVAHCLMTWPQWDDTLPKVTGVCCLKGHESSGT